MQYRKLLCFSEILSFVKIVTVKATCYWRAY